MLLPDGRIKIIVENTELEKAPNKVSELIPYLLKNYRTKPETFVAYLNEYSATGIYNLVIKIQRFADSDKVDKDLRDKANRLLNLIQQYLDSK